MLAAAVLFAAVKGGHRDFQRSFAAAYNLGFYRDYIPWVRGREEGKLIYPCGHGAFARIIFGGYACAYIHPRKKPAAEEYTKGVKVFGHYIFRKHGVGLRSELIFIKKRINSSLLCDLVLTKLQMIVII